MAMAAKIPMRLQGQVPVAMGYQDTSIELWSKIWNTLMGYIDADDTPEKLHQKETLVDLMSLFLSRVSHDSKFYLAATPSVLRSSAEKPGFRPLVAAQAFEALHEYAIRILAQPWRSEFATINMYSGYYVHTVQSNLSEAHRLLEEMGFRVDAATQKATLVEPVDADQVTKAAIDTLMASVECRIIEHILESLPAGVFTARGVLSYRSCYVGGVEAAVRHLTVTLRQKNFQHYFSPPSETPPAAAVTSSSSSAAAPYPWLPVPPAPPPALPPVPTARLVDIGGDDSLRDSVDSGPPHVWIPKTIRHQYRPPADQPRASSAGVPPPDALLPATLDQHQLASWDLVERNSQPPARPPQPHESLDDTWGYVLHSMDRRRPVSGRYDNVPEVNANGAHAPAPELRATTLATERRRAALQSQQQQPYPQQQQLQPRTLPRLDADQRNPFDSRTHVSSSLYQNGNAAAPVSMTRHSVSSDSWGAPQRPVHHTAGQPAAGGGGVGTRASTRGAEPQPVAPRPRQSPAPACQEAARAPEINVWPTQTDLGRLDAGLRHGSTPPRHEPSHGNGVVTNVEAAVSRRETTPTKSHRQPSGNSHSERAVESSKPSHLAGVSVTNRSESSKPSAAGGGPAAAAPAESLKPDMPYPNSSSPSQTMDPSTNAFRASPSGAAPSEQWSCHACTYLNPISVKVCGMCGKSRPQTGRPPAVDPVPVPEEEDDLACPQCTLLNSRRARKCGACDAVLK